MAAIADRGMKNPGGRAKFGWAARNHTPALFTSGRFATGSLVRSTCPTTWKRLLAGGLKCSGSHVCDPSRFGLADMFKLIRKRQS